MEGWFAGILQRGSDATLGSLKRILSAKESTLNHG